MIAALALTAALADDPTVTHWEYDHVTVGDTKPHVARVFDTPGVRVVKWAGVHGWLHILKAYPADDGTTVRVEYVHPPSGGVYRLAWKSREGSKR